MQNDRKIKISDKTKLVIGYEHAKYLATELSELIKNYTALFPGGC